MHNVRTLKLEQLLQPACISAFQTVTYENVVMFVLLHVFSQKNLYSH